MSSQVTILLDEDNTVLINQATRTLVHQFPTGDITVRGNGLYDLFNPLDTPYKVYPLITSIGQILTDLAYGVEDYYLHEEENEPLNFLRQVDETKYIIKDPVSSSFIAINLENFVLDSILSMVIVTPYNHPLILDKVSGSGLENVWKKYRKDYLEAVNKELQKISSEPEVEPTEEESPLSATSTERSWSVSTLDEIVQILAGFVLNAADMEVLQSELTKLKDTYGPNMAMKGFMVFTNVKGDTVVSIDIYDPTDPVPGSFTALTHGDSTRPHGELGWSITEHYMTGTEIEKTARYL